MLGQRHRLCPNIKTALDQCLVWVVSCNQFSGYINAANLYSISYCWPTLDRPRHAHLAVEWFFLTLTKCSMMKFVYFFHIYNLPRQFFPYIFRHRSHKRPLFKLAAQKTCGREIVYKPLAWLVGAHSFLFLIYFWGSESLTAIVQDNHRKNLWAWYLINVWHGWLGAFIFWQGGSPALFYYLLIFWEESMWNKMADDRHLNKIDMVGVNSFKYVFFTNPCKK